MSALKPTSTADQDLAALTGRAMEIQAQFARLQAARGQTPWTKEEIMQGFVGDVGDLMKVVMAKAGRREIPDTDHKLAHELADCLWSILVLARLHEVDLPTAFATTMDEIEESIAQKLATPPSSTTT